MESQNIEWKESWRDEYIKWICGFANAQGGKLYIGKNDKGVVVGIDDSAKLLEEIPNKVRDILGVMVDVNLHHQDGKTFLEIITEAYPNPVSYKGQYHYRTGSTKQELKGASLDKFLLRKHGKRWEGVPYPYVSESDLSKNAFDDFRKRAVKSGRLEDTVLSESDHDLLNKLQLIEGKYLKRASILLFHPEPDVLITGAYIKIGFFRTITDLLFQDEVHGFLFEQVEKALDLILTKYLRAFIRYEGLYRIEEFQYPKTALREALLNAVIHKDYSTGIPIQIKVFEDRITIWNDGELPETWTEDMLKKEHTSLPYNPMVANAFFRAGFIESWGRGTVKIIEDCLEMDMNAPIYKAKPTGFMVDFMAKNLTYLGEGSLKSSPKSTPKSTPKSFQKIIRERSSVKILKLMSKNPTITIPEINILLNISIRGIKKHIENLKNENKIERIGDNRTGYWQVK
jgi:ATP-dependent DNA helicase RecG